MRARGIAAALAAAVALVGLTAMPAHAGREYTSTYTANVPFLAVGQCSPLGVGEGDLCVPVTADDSEVRVRIVDVTGQRALGHWQFYAESGEAIGDEFPPFFCGRTVLDVPEGAQYLVVGAVTATQPNCDVGVSPAGKITAFVS